MSTNLSPVPLFLAPLEWPHAKRGKFFEKVIALVLEEQGYRVQQEVSFTGMEIDLLVQNKLTKKKAYVECKFYKAAFEAEVINKLVGKCVKDSVDALLFTTSQPTKGAKGLLNEFEQKNNAVGPIQFGYI